MSKLWLIIVLLLLVACSVNVNDAGKQKKKSLEKAQSATKDLAVGSSNSEHLTKPQNIIDTEKPTSPISKKHDDSNDVATTTLIIDDPEKANTASSSILVRDDEVSSEKQVKPVVVKKRTGQRVKFENSDAVYDQQSSSYVTLQRAEYALSEFPADSRSRVNWVQAISKDLINPRASVDGSEKMQVLSLDIIMKATRGMPHVKFPHRQHTEWLDCSNCHPKPFLPKTGANDITMTSIYQGNHCGLCHDKVAFSTYTCERCHNILHAGSPTKWW